MKSIPWLAMCLSVSMLAAADSIQQVVDPYLKIQSALATDTMDGVAAQAAAISQAAEALGAPGKEIKASAVQMERAADLKTARQAFGSLTAAVLSYAAATKAALAADVHEAYCPMARKSWLQKGDKTIDNPYYGKSMAGCGEIKKKQ